MISEDAALAAIPPSGFLREYVDYASKCTDANLAYHILGGLVCLAQTLPETLGIPLGGSLLRGNLYALCAGASTKSRKSAAVNFASGILNEACVGTIPEPPGSPEGALESIRDAQGRCCFMYDEFGNFLAQTERGYAVPIKTLYTQAYDCVPLGRALARKREGPIKNVRVSIFGGSTIDFLERHTEPSDWTGGFLARFLTFYTDRERVLRLQPPKPAGRQDIVLKLQALAGLDVVAGPCGGFTHEAELMWNDWYDATESRAVDSVRETQAGVYRAHAMAQKIALILSWDDGRARADREWWIEADLLSYAMKIVDMHLDSVLAIGHQLASTKDGRDQRAVLHVLENARGRAVSRGQIIKLSKVGLKRRVMEVLETLEDRGDVVCVTQDGKNFYVLAERLHAHMESVNGAANGHANGHTNGHANGVSGLTLYPELDGDSAETTGPSPGENYPELEPAPELPAFTPESSAQPPVLE